MNPIVGHEYKEVDGKLIKGKPIYLKDLPIRKTIKQRWWNRIKSVFQSFKKGY